VGVRSDHGDGGAISVDPRQSNPTGLSRIPEGDVSPRDTRWLVQVDVERAALEERWGAPEVARDDFAEWFCFAFATAEGEAFVLLREVAHPPAPGFVLSVTKGLFSLEAADRIVRRLDVAGARITHTNAEAVY
jgi:hypothetical protein